MENKKHTNFIGIAGSEMWQQLKTYRDIYNHQLNNIDDSKPESEIIEHLRSIYSNIEILLERALDYLQTNNVIISEENRIYDYSKDLNYLNFICLEVLKNYNAEPMANEYKEVFNFYKDIAKDLSNEPKKKALGHASISKIEFREYIKVDTKKIEEYRAKNKPKINYSEIEEVNFKNKFDCLEEKTIYDYFHKSLVENNYIDKTELILFLKSAFEEKIIPKEKITFKNIPKQKQIISVFYKYYLLAQKPYGKKNNYVRLLTDYFIGYNFKNIQTNFAKNHY